MRYRVFNDNIIEDEQGNIEIVTNYKAKLRPYSTIKVTSYYNILLNINYVNYAIVFEVYKDHIVVKEEEDRLFNIIKNIKFSSHFELLVKSLKVLLEKDIETLEKIEDDIIELEGGKNYNQVLTNYSNLVLLHHRFYKYLTNIFLILEEDELDIIDDNIKKNVHYFKEELISINEYTRDLIDIVDFKKEFLKNKVNERTNKILSILAIIQGVLMPTSLISAWYGMNFENMPELKYENAYYILIFVCIFLTTTVLLVILGILRKK